MRLELFVAATALGVTLISGTTVQPSPASPTVQTRCGWIDNPTPANWWLHDRDGRWTLGLQGGHQAAGLNRMPDLDRSPEFWVVTNTGEKGYGCVCLGVEADQRRRIITRVVSTRQQTLAVCRTDRRLSPMQ